MKAYRTKADKFSERLYFTKDEVENVCTDELKKFQLYPDAPGSIRIERFIEKRFKVTPAYEDLPSGVMGLTEFGPNGVRRIVISKALAEEGDVTAQHRINTTLAHEAGHGLFHTHLFVLGKTSVSLFEEGMVSDKLEILCRGEAIQGLNDFGVRIYKREWWEFQANMAIGPLLLPRSLVHEIVKPFLTKKGIMGVDYLDKYRRVLAEKQLSDTFDVNPIVARIRLDNLYPKDNGQLRL